MITTKEIFDEEFNLIKQDLIKKHIQLGMKASGNWINSLTVFTDKDTGRISGEKYTEQLIFGRRPGKFPPINAIKKWIIDKGIIRRIKGKITISSLAFLIARKIARSGTRYFQQGGTDLISSVITQRRIQNIINKVGAELTIVFVLSLEKEFEKLVIR